MKINIRKGVFETNSSSTHMFSFTRKNTFEDGVNDADRNVIVARELEDKYEIVRFLLCEINIFGNFLCSNKYGQMCVYDIYRHLNHLSIDNCDSKIIEKVCDILQLKDVKLETEEEVYLFEEKISNYVCQKEQGYFSKDDYKYPISFDSVDGKTVVVDNLSEDERVTLALKYLLFYKVICDKIDGFLGYDFDEFLEYSSKICEIYDGEGTPEEKLKKIVELNKEDVREQTRKLFESFSKSDLENVFFDILNKTIKPEILSHFETLFYDQLVNLELLSNATDQVINELTDDPLKSELWLEGLLDDDYPFENLTYDLGLNCSTIERYKKSLKEYLIKENVVVEVV